MPIDDACTDAHGDQVTTVQQPISAAVHLVNQALRESSSDEVLRLIASTARSALDADIVAITSTEPDDVVVVRAADGRHAGELTGMRLPADHALARHTVESTEPRVMDLRQEESHLANVTQCDLESAVCVPLIREHHRVGAIHLARCHGSPAFTDEEMQEAGVFSAPALMAVEQSREREQWRRFGNAPSPGDTALRQALDGLCEQVVEAFEANNCTVYLLDVDATLWIAAHRGLPDPLAPHEYRKAAHPVWRAMTGRRPVLHPPVSERSRGRDLLDRVRYGRTAPELVCVPITWQGELYGTLCCSFASVQQAEREVRFLNLVATQLAWLADHARLLISSQQKVVEEERQRLARELHDTVSQVLYGIALGARTAQELLSHGESAQLAQPIQYVLQLAQAGLSEMRALISALRSDSLENEGIAALLKKEVEAIRARHNLATETTLDTEPDTSAEAKQVAYRIAREALQNVGRHAKASTLWVRLGVDGNTLVLDVIDDGVGFDPNAGYPGHLGLRSMHERAREVGGSIELNSEPGHGTHVRARIPSSASADT
jgi:signal transduction histidine kinase